MDTSPPPPSNTKYRSRLDRVKGVTVQDLLEFADRREAVIAALLPAATGLEIEAYQLLFRTYANEGMTIYNLANECVTEQIKAEKSDPGFPPGMA